MRLARLLTGLALLTGVAATGYLSRSVWLPLLTPAPATDTAENRHEPHSIPGEVQQVRLSPQAQANLRLIVKPLQVDTYWRTIQVPGVILDRPAQSDRGIVAPVTGVVTRVHHFPGDNVKPGDSLFTLRLLSETLQLTQSELFKTTREIEIAREQKTRLSGAASTGAIAQASIIEIDNQLRRLMTATQAYRTELQTRGLTSEQIDGVAEGKFVAEVVIHTPKSRDSEPSFEVQELKVELGQQVQAGQTLCLLSNHQALYIEGRAFRQETPLLERTAREGWPVQVEFMEEEPDRWPSLDQTFTIRHLGNTIDAASRTFAFYLPLVNQSISIRKDDRTLILWRFRPGQKVRLLVRVEKLENVFVLPADAVVRQGPNAYVFRQNGDLFDRKPVHVVFQDRQHVVIANDGSVPAGLFIAHNAAAQINRVLQSGNEGLPPGFHMHADGSIHSNSAHK
jgi:biotin carboxyl carrier protein